MFYYYLNSPFFSILRYEREEEREEKGNEQRFENTLMDYVISKSQQNVQVWTQLCHMHSRVFISGRLNSQVSPVD